MDLLNPHHNHNTSNVQKIINLDVNRLFSQNRFNLHYFFTLRNVIWGGGGQMFYSDLFRAEAGFQTMKKIALCN